MSEIQVQRTGEVLVRLANGNYVLVIPEVQAKDILNWGDLPEGEVTDGVGVAVSGTDGVGRRVTVAAMAAHIQSAVNGHTPYIDASTRTWWHWDEEAKGYKDSKVAAQGPTGARGPSGPQGPQGPQGVNGVVVEAPETGLWAFEVNEEGHLILHYTGAAQPDFAINEDGHLVLTLGE